MKPPDLRPTNPSGPDGPESGRPREVVRVPEADALLMSGCRDELAAGFDELLARYQDSIYNYVCKMAGNPQDAEDLAQEVFVRAYQSLGSFRSECSFRTWLFRIATNLCVDAYRRRKRLPAGMVSLDEPISGHDGEVRREIPDFRSDPQRILEAKELESRIQRALDALPEKLRAVVLLHDIEGLPYEEIAEIVRCPLGTVKSRLFNARMRLRERLRSYLSG